jgi:hypothetical protein
MNDAPTPLKNAAMIQLASGLINVFLMSTGYLVLGWCGGTLLLSICLCPFGYIFAFAPLILVPVGITEIICGALALSNPKAGGLPLKIGAVAEFLGLFGGGLVGAVAGAAVLLQLRDPDTQAWLAVNRDA